MGIVFPTILVLIAMTIAANMHPEGPALVILPLLACPFFIGGIMAMSNTKAAPIPQIFGVLIMLPGIWIMKFFFEIL